MTNGTETIAAEDLQTVAGLQLFARRVVEGYATGLHQSPHKGISVEFKQHRPYVSGDEIRHLDWKVFGKSDRFYVREYEQETNLRATLLLDCSGSMGYSGQGQPRAAGRQTKHQFGTRLAACLAYLMIQQQDSVGLVSFAEDIREVIPARGRPSHLRTLFEAMTGSQVGGEAELAKVLQRLAPKLQRGGLLILISDCFGDTETLLQSLAQLSHGKHEIIIFQVLDRDELEFPFQGWTRFECLEIDGNHQLIDPAHLRTTYLENLQRFRDELEHGCRRHRIDLVPMTTDEPYSQSLAHYLALRRRRKGRR